MSYPSSRQLVSTPSSVKTGMPYVEFCSELNTLFVGAMTGHKIGPDGKVLTRPDGSLCLLRPHGNRIALGIKHSLSPFQTGEDLSTALRDNRDDILKSVAFATASTFAHGTDVMTDRDLADEFNVKRVRLILTTAEQPATQLGGAGKYEPAWTDMPIVTFDWETDTKDTAPNKKKLRGIKISVSAIAQRSNGSAPGAFTLKEGVVQGYAGVMSKILPDSLGPRISALTDDDAESRKLARAISAGARAQLNVINWTFDDAHVRPLNGGSPSHYRSSSQTVEGIDGLDSLQLIVDGRFDTGKYDV